MNAFSITVHRNGKEYEFSGTIHSWSYSYRVIMQVHQHEVIFEPDEERNIRASVTSAASLNEDDRYFIEQISKELQDLISGI